METTEEKTTFKQWAKKHKEDLIALGFVGSVMGGIVALAVAVGISEKRAYDRELAEWNAYADDMNRWVKEEQDAGNAIYPLDDGTFLVVPNSESKIVRK
jgi:hypothetical protein